MAPIHWENNDFTLFVFPEQMCYLWAENRADLSSINLAWRGGQVTHPKSVCLFYTIYRVPSNRKWTTATDRQADKEEFQTWGNIKTFCVLQRVRFQKRALYSKDITFPTTWKHMFPWPPCCVHYLSGGMQSEQTMWHIHTDMYLILHINEPLCST